MKIALLIQDCTTMGGTERTTCCIANALARRGHEVALVSVFRTEGKCRFPLDGNVRFITLSDDDYSLRLSAVRRLSRLMSVRNRLRRCREIRECDVIVSQKFFAAMLVFAAGLADKCVVGDHFLYDLYRRPLRDLRDFIYRRMAKVVVLTEGNAELFRKAGVKRVAVIPNMLPIEPTEYCGGEPREIIAVGRLTPQKGFDMLIEAVGRIKEELQGWHITIYGEGDDRAMLERMIGERGLGDTVALPGATDSIEKRYAEAAFCVMPSRFEGFPMVLLEAAAAGVPTVAFDCPTGPREILSDGGGLIVEYKNVDALGSAIVRMVGDKSLRERLAQETANIRSRYSEESIYEKWMKELKVCSIN